MKKLLGKTEDLLRQEVEQAAHKSKTPIEDFFRKAAQKYAREVKTRDIERKLRRFLGGCAPPWFVKQYAESTLLDLASRAT